MGGVETHCEELLRRISCIGPQIAITALARSAYTGRDRYQFGTVDVVPLPTVRHIHFEAIVSTFLGILYSRSKRADLLHIHAIGPALLTPLARLLGLKVIVTHHGEDFVREKWGPIARFALRVGECVAMIFADRVIAVSPTIADRLRQNYPRYSRKVIYIPNGAPDKASFDEQKSKVENFGLEKQKYILGVGRLVPEKQFHILIDAFTKISNLLPGIKLVIAGDADFDTPYAQNLKTRASDAIVFLGKQDRSSLAGLYRDCRCFVLPSSHEALAIVALEAVSYGATIIASDIPANRNFKLPDEMYFPLGDSDSLSTLLLSDRIIPAKIREEMLNSFDWNLSARKTTELYLQFATVR